MGGGAGAQSARCAQADEPTGAFPKLTISSDAKHMVNRICYTTFARRERVKR